MYSSFSQSKHLIYIPILAIQLLLIHSVSSLNVTNEYLHHKCLVSEGKYQPKSEYEDNLNKFTRATYHARFTDGYTHATYGGDSNYVTGLFQCRGDSYKINCRNCFAIAVARLRRRCPRNKGAIIWYNQCYLYFSSVESINSKDFDLAKIDYKNTFSMHNPNNMNGDINLFNKKTRDLLHKLVFIASRHMITNKSNNSNSKNYAAGEEKLGTKKMYAMVQCTRLLPFCETCLNWSVNELSKCCKGKQGARVLSTSCNLRYELYPFIRT